MTSAYTKEHDLQVTTVECISTDSFRSKSNNYLIRDSVAKASWKLVYPTIISMIFSSLYGILETIVVGKMATSESLDETTVLETLSIITPIEQGLIHCISSIINTGSSILVSQFIGKQSYEECSYVVGNTLLLQCCNYSITVAFFVSILPSLLRILVQDNELVYQLGLSYLKFVLFASLPSFISVSLTGFIRNQGHSLVCCALSIVCMFVNLLLDYLLIHFTSLRMNGVALSACLAYGLSIFISFWYLQSGKSVFHCHFRSLIPKWPICLSILKMGLPGLISTFFRAFGLLLSNRIILDFSESSQESAVMISCWSMLQKWYVIGVIPLLAFSQGIIPLLAAAFGGKMYARFQETVFLLFKVLFFFAVLFEAGLFYFSPILAANLSHDPAYQWFFTRGMKYLVSTLLLDAISFYVFTILQSIGKGVAASMILFIKEGALLLLQFFLSNTLHSYWGFVYAYPITSILTCGVAVILHSYYCRWIYSFVQLYNSSLNKK